MENTSIPLDLIKEREIASKEEELKALKIKLNKICNEYEIPSLYFIPRDQYHFFIKGILSRTSYEEIVRYFTEKRHYDENRTTIDYILDYYVALISEGVYKESDKRIKRHHDNDLKSLYDSMSLKEMERYLLPYWNESKTVYVPDESFLKVLVNTNNPTFSKTIIESLENKHFYIDLPGLLYYQGSFVDIFSEEEHATIVFMLTKHDEDNKISLLPFSFNFEYVKNGLLNANLSSQKDWNNDFSIKLKGNKDATINSEELDEISNIIYTCFQLICYIASDEAEIKDISDDKMNIKLLGSIYGKKHGKKIADNPYVANAEWACLWSEEDNAITKIKWLPPQNSLLQKFRNRISQ